MFLFEGPFDSPFIIPVVAIMVPIVALVAGAYSRVHTERYRAEQRRDMLARNIPLDQIERVLNPRTGDGANGLRGPSSPMRTAANIRVTAIVLIFSGVSLALFFVLLAVILHQHDILAGAACGIIPFGIGLGFWVDYTTRMRDIARMRDEGQL